MRDHGCHARGETGSDVPLLEVDDHPHVSYGKGAVALYTLREHIGDKLLDTVVRQSIAYAESSERAISILDHRADLGADYVMLADELLGRLKLTAARRRLKPMLEAASANGRPASGAEG